VLYAAPFDADKLEQTGAAHPVRDGIAFAPGDALAFYSLSDDGTLVYVAAEELDVLSLIVAVDRATGEETELLLEPGAYRQPALSPDGRSLALSISPLGEARDLIVVDVATGRSVPLAQSPAAEFAPLWTPGGDRVFFACEVLAYDICSRAPNTSEDESLFLSTDFDKVPYSFSADGMRLIMSEAEPNRYRFISLPLEGGDGRPDTLRVRGTGLGAPAVSPDGKWIAYSSDETGRNEVWVESLDAANPLRYVVSTGVTPLWTKGGSELVYREGLTVYAVALDPISGAPGTPESLFEGHYVLNSNTSLREYDVSPAGERFIMVKRPEDELPRRLVVVTHFFEVLKRLVAN
jgi:Tol biopolymer transport system component